MSYAEDARLKNEQIDKFTNKFNLPLPFKVASVEDLKDLRQAWLERESVPCLIENRDQATNNSFLGLDIRTFLSGDNSSGRLSAHDIIVAAGSGLPRHFQTEGDLFMSVIEGELELTVGKLTKTAHADSYAYIPPNTTAAIQNKSNSPARLFLVSYPAGIDRAFSEAHAQWVKSGDQSAEPYLAILERYGFRFDVSGPQQNDSRTNMQPERLEADVFSVDDFQSLRANWNTRRPIPKLILSAQEGHGQAPISSDKGSASAGGGPVINGDESCGHAVMFAGEAGPHYSAFEHYQPTEEELFFVVKGDLELKCGSKRMQLKPGAFGFAPRCATHGFLNPSEQVTKVITINSPAGHERGFEMLARHQAKPYGNIEEMMRAFGWEARDLKDLQTI